MLPTDSRLTDMMQFCQIVTIPKTNYPCTLKLPNGEPINTNCNREFGYIETTGFRRITKEEALRNAFLSNSRQISVNEVETSEARERRTENIREALSQPKTEQPPRQQAEARKESNDDRSNENYVRAETVYSRLEGSWCNNKLYAEMRAISPSAKKIIFICKVPGTCQFALEGQEVQQITSTTTIFKEALSENNLWITLNQFGDDLTRRMMKAPAGKPAQILIFDITRTSADAIVVTDATHDYSSTGQLQVKAGKPATYERCK